MGNSHYTRSYQRRAYKKKKEEGLTLKRIDELLDYYVSTGEFYWKSGKRAGTVHSAGYEQIQIDKVGYLSHKLVWFIHNGEWPDGYLTHKNGNRSDNRIRNLVIKGKVQ